MAKEKVKALDVPIEMESVIDADSKLDFSKCKTTVPVYLKRMWGRDVGVNVGESIGYVVLRDGVDLNLFVDAVRNGFAGDNL